ncbi:MAG: S53 family peptidase [Isosphaeraceae bacterium]
MHRQPRRPRTIPWSLEGLEVRQLLSVAPAHPRAALIGRMEHRLATLAAAIQDATSGRHALMAQSDALSQRIDTLSTRLHAARLKAARRELAASIAGTIHPNRGLTIRPMVDDGDIIDVNPIVSDPNTASGLLDYFPSQVRKAYGIDQIANQGQGVTIAIVDAFDNPNIASDLATFSATFGLPQMDGLNGNPTFTKQKIGNPRGNTGWGEEIALDVEWVHAMAPKANILLVEATTNSNANLYAGVRTAAAAAGVVAVTNSWSGGESSTEASNDATTFSTPSGHTPVSFFFSAGDSGAIAPYGGPQYPSVSPNVVSVGGTALYTKTAAGKYWYESAWGRYIGTSTQEGGGGGMSAYEPVPTYQTGLGYARRATPDISLLADEYTGVAVYDTYESNGGGWYQIGGTSLASPALAAIVGIADSIRLGNGLAMLDTNAILTRSYGVYGTPAYATVFHDITLGNNGYAAATGYDLASGLGTPYGPAFVQLLSS